MSDYENIIYEVKGPRANIIMNRPDSLNGITNAMMRELYDALIRVALDQDVRALLFTALFSFLPTLISSCCSLYLRNRFFLVYT